MRLARTTSRLSTFARRKSECRTSAAPVACRTSKTTHSPTGAARAGGLAPARPSPRGSGTPAASLGEWRIRRKDRLKSSPFTSQCGSDGNAKGIGEGLPFHKPMRQRAVCAKRSANGDPVLHLGCAPPCAHPRESISFCHRAIAKHSAFPAPALTHNQVLKGLTAMMPQYICPSFRSSVRMLSQPIRSAAATICAS